jgi:hypothetical protein
MTEQTASLPGGFEGFSPYAETWGKLKSQEDRYLLRQSSTMEELNEFYQVAVPRLEQVFDHLDKFPLESLPPSEALLFNTILGLTEVAQAVELFNQPRVPYAPFPHEIDIVWRDFK